MQDLINTGYIHQVPDIQSAVNRNIYVGIGLSGKKMISEGIPFDLISYVLASVFIQRIYGLGQVYILIADVHAQNNYFAYPSVVEEKAEYLERCLLDVLDKFQINNCHIVRSKYIATTKEYQDKLQVYQQLYSNDYVARELADIWFFYHYLNTRVKISWKDPRGELQYDESFFDSKYIGIEKNGPHFVYTMPGFDFREEFNYVAPYTFFAQQSRIHINTNLTFAEQIQTIHCGSTSEKITKGEKMYEDQIKIIQAVWGKVIPGNNVWKKIEYIGEHILKI